MKAQSRFLLAALFVPVFVGCRTGDDPAPRGDGGFDFEHLDRQTTTALEQGLRTELTLSDPRPTIGRPIRLTLSFANNGPGAVIYDSQQVAVNNSLRIVGPDGKRIPYVYPEVQTGGRDRELKPGETVVLFKDLDIAQQYHIQKPGTYSAQFTGSGLSVVPSKAAPSLLKAGTGKPVTFREVERDSNTLLMSRVRIPSRVIHFSVAPGEPTDASLATEALLRVLPKGWVYGVMQYPEGKGYQVSMRTREGGMRPKAAVVLSFGRETPHSPTQILGTRKETRVYMTIVPGTEKHWPRYASIIREALGLRDP